MNIENFESLKEKLYRKGFGDKLNTELEKNIREGKTEFALEHFVHIDEDEVGYRLHFRKDAEKDKVYFNKYDTAIFKNAEAPGVRKHTFPTSKMITAMEAYRMLKYGTLVAVNKNLINKDGETYNTWISLDINGPKDEHNNYPVHTYHQNYYRKQPFILSDALKNMPVPVKELESLKKSATIEKMLQKADLVTVTILYNGKETTGILSVNPKAGRVDLYDKQMQIIEGREQQSEQKAVTAKGEKVTSQQNDVKKKPGQEAEVKWKTANRQHKAISR